MSSAVSGWSRSYEPWTFSSSCSGMFTPGMIAEIRFSWSISLTSTRARVSTLPLICCGFRPKVVPAPNGFRPITPTSFSSASFSRLSPPELLGQEQVGEDDHGELRILVEHAAEDLGVVGRDAQEADLALLLGLLEDLDDHVERLVADHQHAWRCLVWPSPQVAPTGRHMSSMSVW